MANKTKRLKFINESRECPSVIGMNKGYQFPVVDGYVELPEFWANLILKDDPGNWQDVNEDVVKKVSEDMPDQMFLTMSETDLKNTTKDVLVEKAKKLGIKMVWVKFSKKVVLEAIQAKLSEDKPE